MKLIDKNKFFKQLNSLLDSNIDNKNISIDEIETYLKQYIKDKKERINQNTNKPKRKRTRKKKIVRPPLFISDSSDDELELVNLNN